MSYPSGSYSPAKMSLVDAGNEVGTFRIFGTLLTAGNFAAKRALWATLVAAVQAICLGAVSVEEYGVRTLVSWAQPTNGAAREVKLLTQYEDATTHQRFSTTIPTLDPALPDYVINVNARDVILTTSPSGVTDYITAFNAFAVSPLTGNACQIIGLKVVGRNN